MRDRGAGVRVFEHQPVRGTWRPFAEVAGVAEELDWTVPRDLDRAMYDVLVDLGLSTLPPGDAGRYYAPFAR